MNMLTAEQSREQLDYNPETGEFRWKVPRNGVIVGAKAGTDCHDGYISIRIFGKRYMAHRLAWLHHYGEWPIGGLDHINGQRWDNRIVNLRLATPKQSAANRGPHWKISAD
jgi:hypothetical protein